MNPTEKDIKNVSEWFSTDISNVICSEIESIPLSIIEKDIVEMLGTYDEFPKDRKRTEKIIKAIQETGNIYPVYIEKNDPFNFVMEGRHRMVAFYLLGMKEIPVCYVENKAKKHVMKMR